MQIKNTPLLLLLFLISLNTFSQEKVYAVGSNLNFSYNKINGGVQFTILKEERLAKTMPSWIFNVNYGLLGTITFNQEVDTTGGGLSFIYKDKFNDDPYEPLPHDTFTPGTRYYVKEHFVKNIGWNISAVKEIRISSSFFFGIGMGHANIKDKGYLIWEDPFTADVIQRNINIDVSTIYFITNIGYHYDFNEKWFINGLLNMAFHTPITVRSRDDDRYLLNTPSLPNIGTVYDLSVSINYKF